MAYLIDKEKVLEALDEVEEIKGIAYIEMLEKIRAIPIQVVERDCNGCFGASFGDCETCEKYVPYGAIGFRTQAQKKLVGAVDWIDNGFKTYGEVIKEWKAHFERKDKHRRPSIWDKIKSARWFQ